MMQLDNSPPERSPCESQEPSGRWLEQGLRTEAKLQIQQRKIARDLGYKQKSEFTKLQCLYRKGKSLQAVEAVQQQRHDLTKHGQSTEDEIRLRNHRCPSVHNYVLVCL